MVIAASPAIAIMTVPALNQWAEERFPFKVTRSRSVAMEPTTLFTDVKSVGTCAIGRAEGTYTKDCKPSSLHKMHIDPGNFRRNSGWCSDQGRAGGDPDLADKMCLQRARARMPVHLTDLEAVGIAPTDTEAVVNTADLYNQAAPVHSRKLPQLLVEERQKHGKTVEAIAHARTRSFGEQGEAAGGLIGICRREGRLQSTYDCVYQDQLRRVKAIDGILKSHPETTPTLLNASRIYFPIPGQTYETAIVTSGYGWRRLKGQSDWHGGVDFGGAIGTPLIATEAGIVTAVTSSSTPGNNGCGNGVVYQLRRDAGIEMTYCHMNTVVVKTGQALKAGQLVGTLGNTGRSTGPHLHGQLRVNGEIQNPTAYFQAGIVAPKKDALPRVSKPIKPPKLKEPKSDPESEIPLVEPTPTIEASPEREAPPAPAQPVEPTPTLDEPEASADSEISPAEPTPQPSATPVEPTPKPKQPEKPDAAKKPEASEKLESI